MTLRIFVPRDAGALAVGADEVAAALARRGRGARLDVEIVRTGSRGMYWLEPLVEVETPAGRVGYGPVDAGRCRRRCSTPACSTAGAHRCGSAWPRRFPSSSARPASPSPAAASSIRGRSTTTAPMAATRGCERAHRARARQAIVEEVIAIRPARPRRRRLPDRHQVAAPSPTRRPPQKYIVCNADEGDSGTFADRMIMEGDPFVLIEGMAIAGIAVGATKGYVYIRSEYPHADRGDGERDRERARGRHARRARRRLAATPSTSRCASAPAPMSAARRPRCSKASKASAARSAPSRRCRRTRACSASRPSSTTCCRSPPCRSSWRRAPRSIAISAWAARAAPCRSSSPATSSTAACSRRPSASRSASWSTTSAAARASGRPVRAVQVGGPLGAYFPRALFDTPFDYEAFAAARRADRPWRHRRVRRHASTWRSRRASPWSSAPSNRCGKCTPCRIGSTRGVEVIDRIIAGEDARREPRAARRSLRHDEVRIALRARRLHALSGDERAHPFPRGFRRDAAPAGC